MRRAMEPNLKEISSKETWQRIFPYLDDATLQLVHPHLRDAALRFFLYPNLEELPDDTRGFIQEMFYKTPASPEQRAIVVLADLVVALINPEKLLPGLINKACGEIAEAYQVILHEGGGWSFSGTNPEKRKSAVLAWYQRNRPRLSYLQESFLQDIALYEDRGGQEKRDFRARLLSKIIEYTTSQELTLSEIKNLLETIKKSK